MYNNMKWVHIRYICHTIHDDACRPNNLKIFTLPITSHRIIIWFSKWKKNIPSDICVKRRLKSACASAQSDQSLRSPHEESLHPWLFKMRPRKILIWLRECAGWSESLLGTHVRGYVLWRCDSFLDNCLPFKIQQLLPITKCIIIVIKMILIGATYIRASKSSSQSCFIGGLAISNWIWFQTTPDLNPLHELRYNVEVNNISVVQRHCLQICETFTRPDHMNSGPA